MNVKIIGYGRGKCDCDSQQLGEYVYFEAGLESWENPDESFVVLRERVNSKLGIHEDVVALDDRRHYLTRRIEEQEALLKSALDRWEKIQEVYKKIDLLVPEDLIPF